MSSENNLRIAQQFLGKSVPGLIRARSRRCSGRISTGNCKAMCVLYLGSDTKPDRVPSRISFVIRKV